MLPVPRLLAMLVIGAFLAACSSGSPSSSPPRAAASATAHRHARNPACLELRDSFRPLIADVRAATDPTTLEVDALVARRRLARTITGLRHATAIATSPLLRRRLGRVLRRTVSLRGRLSEHAFVFRLGLLNEAYAHARAAC